MPPNMPTLRFSTLDPIPVLPQSIGQGADFVGPDQPIQAAFRDSRFAVMSPRDLPTNGRCRVRVIAKICRSQNGISEIGGLPETPQGCLQAANNIARPRNVAFRLRSVIAPSE